MYEKPKMWAVSETLDRACCSDSACNWQPPPSPTPPPPECPSGYPNVRYHGGEVKVCGVNADPVVTVEVGHFGPAISSFCYGFC